MRSFFFKSPKSFKNSTGIIISVTVGSTVNSIANNLSYHKPGAFIGLGNVGI
jgi:hypothetical protein